MATHAEVSVVRGKPALGSVITGRRLHARMRAPMLLILLSLGGIPGASSCPAQDDLSALPIRARTSPPVGMSFLPRTEANQLVFEITSPSDFNAAGNSRTTSGSAAVANDGAFPDYSANQGVTYPILVNGIAFGWIATGPAATGHFDCQITFFDTIDMTPQAQAAPFYSTFLGTFRSNDMTPNWGFVEWFQNPVALVDSVGNPRVIPFPDRFWGWEVKIFEAGTHTLWNGAAHAGSSSGNRSQIVPLIRGGGGAVPATGTSTPNYFRNDPASSDASGGAVQTILNTSASSVGTDASRRDVYLKLSADIAGPELFGVESIRLDCSTEGAFSRTFSVVPGELRFYRLLLLSNASVDADTFLDLTTTTDGPDMGVALYDGLGDRVATDADDGDQGNPQLSFGHGRRPAIGDGFQADGRDGDLVAGSYYLALAGAGTVFGPSGFSVDASASVQAGFCTVHGSYNTGTPPCPLPPPVAPAAVDVGSLARGVTTVRTVEAGFGRVAWLRFETADSIHPARPAHFLDISVGAGVDAGLALYDAAGNLVASDQQDQALSFSTPGVTPPRSGFDGQSGSILPAGVYFLAAGLAQTDFRASGWQARSNSGSSLSLELTLTTSAGCDADYNADGSVNPDDLGDFITAYFEQSPRGPRSDYNADGEVNPDDLGDYITAYFSNTCP